jgi:hypothetical protein
VAWGVSCRGAIAVLLSVSTASCLGSCDCYQIVDSLSAKCADQMERKLDGKDYQDKRRHDRRVNHCNVELLVVWVRTNRLLTVQS